MVYAEDETELPDRSDQVRSVMKTRQDNDMTDHTSVTMLKMRLSSHDQSNLVQSMMKTRLDNNMIDHTGVVYIENETKLLYRSDQV